MVDISEDIRIALETSKTKRLPKDVLAALAAKLIVQVPKTFYKLDHPLASRREGEESEYIGTCQARAKSLIKRIVAEQQLKAVMYTSCDVPIFKMQLNYSDCQDYSHAQPPAEFKTYDERIAYLGRFKEEVTEAALVCIGNSKEKTFVMKGGLPCITTSVVDPVALNGFGPDRILCNSMYLCFKSGGQRTFYNYSAKMRRKHLQPKAGWWFGWIKLLDLKDKTTPMNFDIINDKIMTLDKNLRSTKDKWGNHEADLASYLTTTWSRATILGNKPGDILVPTVAPLVNLWIDKQRK